MPNFNVRQFKTINGERQFTAHKFEKRNKILFCLDPRNIDCQDYLWEGYRQNGLYTIYPQKGGRLEVYCDQQTDGGGWTVRQQTLHKQLCLIIF